MAQMSLEDLYRREGAGEKYGILGELMKDFFKNGCPSKYDERRWLDDAACKARADCGRENEK